ncbi:unnamed protein product [Kuraishia capsulata CBS 1993]|uniref:Uncharacterized protein n=1 Tax=Kuraishia capsulata CBS 1993 TaxID=1382522 RepID=W6MHX5_9ASCO|nr:uncharacterized protein KUCA_T00001621001 [Kuraishia capsulata CBS 1993]CDK25651.1 unnamed protein product [Kuraishia capsulata CBS 1993]
MSQRFEVDGKPYYEPCVLYRAPTILTGEFCPVFTKDIRVMRPVSAIYGARLKEPWALLRNIPIYKVAITGYVVSKSEVGFELNDSSSTVTVRVEKEILQVLNLRDLVVICGVAEFLQGIPVVRAYQITRQRTDQELQVLSEWRRCVLGFKKDVLSKRLGLNVSVTPSKLYGNFSPTSTIKLRVLEILMASEENCVSEDNLYVDCKNKLLDAGPTFKKDAFDMAINELELEHILIRRANKIQLFDYFDVLVQYLGDRLLRIGKENKEKGNSRRVIRHTVRSLPLKKVLRRFPFLRLSFETLNHIIFTILQQLEKDSARISCLNPGKRWVFQCVEDAWKPTEH